MAPFLTARAQSSWYDQSPTEWYLKVYDPSQSPPNEIFGERYTAAQVQWVVWSFLFLPIRAISSAVGEDTVLCVIKEAGASTLNLNNCFGAVTNMVNKIGSFLFPAPVTSTGNKSFIAKVFDSSNRNISGIKYVKELVNKLSPVSEVKAQGIGYTGLTWIQQYWKGFRNIAYALLVPVVIVFAFMIIFRVKINPQTVISIQVAIPKIITAMILVTFSYAIAGFAIDLMYIVSALFALLLNLAGFSSNLAADFGFISGTGIGYTAGASFWVFFNMLGYTIFFFIAAIITVLSSMLSGGNLFGAVLGIVFMLIAVWVLVLCIFYTFKIPFVLIKTLISMYVSIITAPVQILAGALVPSMGFGNWFKRLMADILVFPLVGLLFWFAWSTLWSVYAQSGYDVVRFWSNSLGIHAYPNAWIPGMIGTNIWGTNSGMSGIIFLGISFSMIVLIPKAPDILKAILLGEKFAFGTAFGEATGAAKTAWGMTGGSTFDALRRYQSAQATAGYAGKLYAMTEPGKRLEKAPQWFKDFLKNAGNKPENPYH